MSPALYRGSSTQIRQGVRGAITTRLTRNHSPPRALTARMTWSHDVQIRVWRSRRCRRITVTLELLEGDVRPVRLVLGLATG